MITGTWVLVLWFNASWSGIDHIDGFYSENECRVAAQVIQKSGNHNFSWACINKGKK